MEVPPAVKGAVKEHILSSLLANHEEQRKAARQSDHSHNRRQRQGVGSLGRHVQRPQVDNLVSTGIA